MEKIFKYKWFLILFFCLSAEITWAANSQYHTRLVNSMGLVKNCHFEALSSELSSYASDFNIKKQHQECIELAKKDGYVEIGSKNSDKISTPELGQILYAKITGRDLADLP